MTVVARVEGLQRLASLTLAAIRSSVRQDVREATLQAYNSLTNADLLHMSGFSAQYAHDEYREAEDHLIDVYGVYEYMTGEQK